MTTLSVSFAHAQAYILYTTIMKNSSLPLYSADTELSRDANGVMQFSHMRLTYRPHG